jgi:hypothetical protein
MSATILTTASNPTSDQTTIVGRQPAPTARRRRRLLQFAAGGLVALTSALGVFTPNADAALVGPDPVVNFAESIAAELYCAPGKIGITAYTSVQSYYFRGQYVRWQYYISNSNGWGQYSNWSGDNYLQYNNYSQHWLGTAYRQAVSGTTWNAQVRVAYWTGSNWSVSRWVPAGKKMQGYSDWQVNCWT